MNLLQYYLNKLAEECGEVAKEAQKTMQFGPREVMLGQELTNFERCHHEIDDVFAMIEELNEKFEFGYKCDAERIAKKKERVKEYLQYSIDLGMVIEPTWFEKLETKV